MKATNLLFVLAGLLLLASCGPDIHFTEPQPPDEKNEGQFRKKYRGEYVSLSDSSLLTITDTRITQTWPVDTKVHKDSLEIEDFSAYPNFKFTEEGDTVHITGWESSDIFNISEDQVLRYSNGYYFLNTKEGEDFWTVQLLSLERKLLTFKYFKGTEEEMTKLSELTAIDTVLGDDGKIKEYRIHPSAKEFKQILKSANFWDGGSFRKIK